MPLHKTDGTINKNDGGNGQNADTASNGRKFPPEAFTYDSDITDAGIEQVKAEASKRLKQDDWVLIDGDKR